jgi:hypothetical protein
VPVEAAAEAPSFEAPAFVPPTAGYVAPELGGSSSLADAREFIGPNADYYLEAFKKLDATNSMISWNWAACLGGLFWMLYRKMYVYALIAFAGIFVLSLVTGGLGGLLSIIVWIAFGVLGNWIYKKKVEEDLAAAAGLDPAAKQTFFASRGGTTWLPVIIGAVLFALMFLTICGLGACAAMLSTMGGNL